MFLYRNKKLKNYLLAVKLADAERWVDTDRLVDAKLLWVPPYAIVLVSYGVVHESLYQKIKKAY